KVLYDLGVVTHDEPFQKLLNQGLILGADGEKMSKSRGNVVNPDDVIREYGADSLRMYEMFMGPIDRAKPWSTEGLGGIFRFLNRIWRLYIDENDQISTKIGEQPVEKSLDIAFHKTVKVVTAHIEEARFNTAIAQMMIFINECYKSESLQRTHMLDFIRILSAFAPHLAEELWERMGMRSVLSRENWPLFDPAKARDEEIEYPVQINGKVRFKLLISADANEEMIRNTLINNDKYDFYMQGKTIVKMIIIPKRIITLVIK
ncbi:MAG: class I tRNA ligase family protein, partial [bacterium]|nr:class I tRNA ligase family protein [bacterium]